MSRRKRTPDCSLIYPFFLAVKEYTLDPFWHDVLDSIAYGANFEGLSVQENTLTIGSEEFDCSCFEDEGETEARAETSIQIVCALRDELGIMSESEKFDKKLSSHSCEESADVWAKIKNKAKRELLVLEYTELEQKNRDISDDERQNLYWFLITSLELGCIKSDCVHMNDGKIETIDGLVYDPENASYSLEEFVFPPSKASSKAKGKSKLRVALRKYILAKSKPVKGASETKASGEAR